MASAYIEHIVLLLGDNIRRSARKVDKETRSKYEINGNNLSISATLSIIGGAIMIIGGISTIFMFGWYQSTFGGIHWMSIRYYMHQDTGSWSHSIAMPSGNTLGA